MLSIETEVTLLLEAIPACGAFVFVVWLRMR